MPDPSMPGCTSPLWPCGMTGAAACLAGIPDLAVVIHGSSGCFFYPQSLIPVPLFSTFIEEREVIFGSVDRLGEVLGSIPPSYRGVAVVTTCVPAIVGEEIREILDDRTILVDAPGFAGQMEEGYRRALDALGPETDPGEGGVNIAGLNLLDPFSQGNLLEAERLLALAGVPAGVRITRDPLDRIGLCGPVTVSVNPDLPPGAGEEAGTFLGLSAVERTFARLGDRYPEADIGPVLAEVSRTGERIQKAADKYLRRFDPPVAAVFGGSAYGETAAEALHRYLDADILVIGSRNAPPGASRFPARQMADLGSITGFLAAARPDLVVGSSFERSACPGAAFAGLTPPLRGRVLLRSRALAGIEGTLSFMEEALNACIDRKRKIAR
ncbi:MAG TPA: nitrogenase component 1 [Methanomicrobiales archaeon]|nr:nitrogenase component 1 [Methanomicrobiales archaeon]